jgi:hypothetical protein
MAPRGLHASVFHRACTHEDATHYGLPPSLLILFPSLCPVRRRPQCAAASFSMGSATTAPPSSNPPHPQTRHPLLFTLCTFPKHTTAGESNFAIVVVVAATEALLRSRSTVTSSMVSLAVRGLACSLSCMSRRSCRVHCFRRYRALLAGTNRCTRRARHCCCCRELEYALHVCILLDLTHVLCVPRVDRAECKMLPPELARTASNTTTPTSSHGYTANATHGHVVVVDFVSRS